VLSARLRPELFREPTSCLADTTWYPDGLNRLQTDSAVLSSVERTDSLAAAEAAEQPKSIRSVKEDCGKDSKKANAKFQLDTSEISGPIARAELLARRVRNFGRQIQ
jgi:hypothetical protein